ncbi:hypothetical protein D9758_003063 [Tetrapyrgos nigripes]|uniref:Fatty acid desaturase domain-containing protein n=1 Tax=Tetrapyrgos nigripes TaxID=182062 RepID=A0A8H5GPS1_9AGAR|nr:hypothetical protein D9758_003063 [Tetrapyrgos nigripes]
MGWTNNNQSTMLSYFAFSDSPEYIRRKNTPFTPTHLSIQQIRAAIPKELFEKSTVKGLAYVALDIFFAVVLYKLAWQIDAFSSYIAPQSTVFKWSLWSVYWFAQSVVLAGWWCMAHEAGHGNISKHKWVNNLVGFGLHTFVLAPYFAWRASHSAHHKATVNIERDENYVPRTRSQLGLPALPTRDDTNTPVTSGTLEPVHEEDHPHPEGIAHPGRLPYHEMVEETPIAQLYARVRLFSSFTKAIITWVLDIAETLFRMFIMQTMGWQIYLFTDVSGSPRHPKGTNHFLPSSSLFASRPSVHRYLIISDLGILVMMALLYLWARSPGVGAANLVKLYGVPYIFLNHWIVLLTFLHHSDPTLPYYHSGQWSFARGALSTVDRPLLSWGGRLFLKNVSHDHISHHLFSNIPWYNQPRSTAILRELLASPTSTGVEISPSASSTTTSKTADVQVHSDSLAGYYTRASNGKEYQLGHYNYDSTPWPRAFWRSFRECLWIDDLTPSEGDSDPYGGAIVFYRNREGKMHRELGVPVTVPDGTERTWPPESLRRRFCDRYMNTTSSELCVVGRDPEKNKQDASPPRGDLV